MNLEFGTKYEIYSLTVGMTLVCLPISPTSGSKVLSLENILLEINDDWFDNLLSNAMTF